MKNTLRTALLVLLFSVFAFTGNAQMGMGKVEEILAVKARKLIVIIEEPYVVKKT